jgi:putative endonuclease
MKQKTLKMILGDRGEDDAVRFLTEKGFKILDRKYRKKWGEIDVVAMKNKIIHFVEVKTVTRYWYSSEADGDVYRAEDNVHPWKLKRLGRVTQTYLLDNVRRFGENMDWQFDLITAVFDGKTIRIIFEEDIIL